MIIIIVLLNIIFSFGGGKGQAAALKKSPFFVSHSYLGHVTIEAHCWVICVKVGENQPELKPHNL